MKNRTILILLYALAIGLLFAFSFLPSSFRMYSNALALFLPLAIGVSVFVKKNGTKIPMYEGEGERALPYLFFAPTLLLIILISLVTSVIFSLFGLYSPPLEDIPLLDAVIAYAILPAVLEECFFRILPVLALKEEDTQSICLFSALVFGFAHLSVFSIPYALFAGVVFFFLNRIARSSLPSLLLHLFNNLISILLIYATNYELVFTITISALLVLTGVSLVLMWLFYKERLRSLIDVLRAQKATFHLTLDLALYLVLTATLTILFI